MNRKFSLLILLSFLITSCGDLFMLDKKDKKTSLSQLATCELDMDAFSKILEKNIRGDIICLQDQIHTFIDLVASDRPGFISEKVLIEFLEDGPVDMGEPEKVIPIVRSLFDFSKVILGGERGYISRGEFDRMINLLISFNQNIYPLYKIFISDNEISFGDYQRNRNTVQKYLTNISQEFRTLLNMNRTDLDRMDIYVFLDRFFTDHEETSEQIKSLMFLKRVFLGGQVYDLTYLELEMALAKMADLGQVAYDLVKVNQFNFAKDAQKMIEVYREDMRIIQSSLYYDNDSYEALFTVYDVLDAMVKLDVSIPEIDIAKYPNEIITLKKALLGSGGEFVSSVEVVALLDHLNNILDEGRTFYRIYEMYKDELNSVDPITTDFSGYPAPPNSPEVQHLRHFSEIANNYRFFKGTFTAPYFSFEHYRNPGGFFEIMVAEYLVTLIFKEYGNPNDEARGGYHMTLEQTVLLMDDIKVVLRDLGIITIGRVGGGEVANTADNLVLMSTLFQNQSNGCDDDVCMEVPEITEFLVGLLTAMEVKDFFIEQVESFCPEYDDDGNLTGNRDEYGRIMVGCFRKNFVNALEKKIPGDGRSLAEYMPLLSSYITELTDGLEPGQEITDSADYMKFITETESFTRTCTVYSDGSDVPMKSNDAFAVFAGLLNVESTLMRFDANQNNKLDGYGRGSSNEVLTAYYEVYQGAIKGLVDPNGGFLTKLAKPIFQYLVKYGKVPDTSKFKSIWAFIKFLLKFNKGADATRTTIATILKTLGEQSENSQKYPFKCDECLSDPNVQCLPEDDSWDDELYRIR
jgi:hypothetical protein